MANINIKCQKCRFELASNESSRILDCHENPIKNKARVTYSCNENLMENNWYLSSTVVPNWINSLVEEGDWQKGKLTCPNCNLRVGSFDFVNGMKCPCKKYVLPQIHLVKTYPLTILFRWSLDEDVVTIVWKTCSIIPVFKAGNPSNVSNNQPISILLHLTKLFEALVHSTIKRSLNHLIPDSQHGFRPGRVVSDLSPISSGVPQGGHLSRILFIFAMSSSNERLSFAKVLHFADDIKIFS
ncbi:Reverse transcriptase domain [Cinara cedri]|uniref:Reverse transcriptase domain n=1 Tax=Cinara cedri TaxID=506608 RepID=A0A5E4M2J6_9HEMI|nr:Reverse transcriptase domain [Cinara cedri]